MENNKFSLLIDGCLDYLELAVIKDETIVDSSFEIQEKNLTKILNPSIAFIIEKNNLEKENLESIYIVNGPGSFTSVKSVVLFGNTFKKVFQNVDLYFLNSTQWNTTQEDEIVLIDAKTKLFYVGANNIEKPFLIQSDEIDKLTNKYKKYFYSLETKKSIYEKWQFNKKRFLKTSFIRPLYIKEAIYDYSKKQK